MITTLYSTACLCFEPLLTQHGRIARMKCVRDTMGQNVNAEHLPGHGPQLASLLQVRFLLHMLTYFKTS